MSRAGLIDLKRESERFCSWLHLNNDDSNMMLLIRQIHSTMMIPKHRYDLDGGNSNIINFHPDPWGNDTM